MKLINLLPAAVLTAAVMLTGCAGDSSAEEPAPAETTAAETTAAAPETTEETTTTTTTTTLPYIVPEHVSLTYQTASARPAGCVMELSVSGEEPFSYQEGDFKIYDSEGKELKLTADEDWKPKIKTASVPAGETAEIKYKWDDRYGELSEGSYLLEQIVSRNDEADTETDDSGESSEKKDTRPTVLRAEFQIVGTDYAPVLKIDPASVSTTGCTLSITNAPDQARDYTPSFKVFEAGTNNLYMREIDRESVKNNLAHYEPGASGEITYNWARSYGRLPDGKYELQVEFTGCDDRVSSTYRVLFEVIT